MRTIHERLQVLKESIEGQLNSKDPVAEDYRKALEVCHRTLFWEGYEAVSSRNLGIRLRRAHDAISFNITLESLPKEERDGYAAVAHSLARTIGKV